MSKKVEIMNGNEIVAEAAIAAGCRFYAGYPITPSSEIPEHLSKRMPEVGGIFVQFEDEIASIIAAVGASYAGYKVMTASSGPGISLKQEGVGLACMMELPVVIVNVMRGGPSTGLPTRVSQADYMQARWGTHGDHMVIGVAPSTLLETYEETIRAFGLAEKYRTPVYVFTDAVLAHLNGRIELPDISEFEIVERKQPEVPPEEYMPYDVERFGDIPPLPNKDNFRRYRFHMTGLNKDETGFPVVTPEFVEKDEERMINKIMKNVKDIEKFEYYKMDDAELVVVSFGSNANAARIAVDMARELGIKAGMFRPITVWPFPEEQMRDISKSIHRVVVSEINLGQMLEEVRKAAECGAEIFSVLQAAGIPIRPNQILEKIKEVS